MTHPPRLFLAGCFALFAAWSLVVPINEAPDEPAHWQYARHLREHWSLPRYAPGFEEANSPPLAYALFAPFATDASGPEILQVPNATGGFERLAWPRTFLNTGEDYQRYWPQRLARLLAAAISVGTVFFTWHAGLAAGGRPVAWLAALLTALLPTFAFRAGHVSNDALVACLSAAATWGIVRLVREPFSWRVAWWTSAAVGLAYMSKISAIALVPAFAVALILAAPAAGWPVRARRLAALLLAGAIVAPWSIRNVVLYGDPFASEAMRVAVAHIITDRSLFDGYFASEFPRMLAKSFVGIFGWATLLMPTTFYRAYWLLFSVGGAGLLVALVRRRIDWRLAGVLAVAGLAALAVVVRINLQFTQPQGRYLFPGLPAFAVLVALGLDALRGSLRQAVSPPIVGSVLLAGNLYALVGAVWPGYHPAPLRTLPSGERVMLPTFLTDMVAVDADLRWRITGPAPSWMTRIDTPAAPFAAFEVELTATTTPAAQQACVYYATDTRAMHENPPVCGGWSAAGQPQRVRIPLRGQPGWSGTVTHLRLNPFAAGAGVAGTEVSTRGPRLTPR
jgi:hypothetical protein